VAGLSVFRDNVQWDEEQEAAAVEKVKMNSAEMMAEEIIGKKPHI